LRLYSIYKPSLSDFRYFVLFQIYSNANAHVVTSTDQHVQPSELPPKPKEDEWVIKWMFVDVKDAKNFERQIVLMQYV
jgi:hypothetical protein